MFAALLLLLEALLTMAIAVVWTVRKLLGFEEPERLPNASRGDRRPPDNEPHAS